MRGMRFLGSVWSKGMEPIHPSSAVYINPNAQQVACWLIWPAASKSTRLDLKHRIFSSGIHSKSGEVSPIFSLLPRWHLWWTSEYKWQMFCLVWFHNSVDDFEWSWLNLDYILSENEARRDAAVCLIRLTVKVYAICRWVVNVRDWVKHFTSGSSVIQMQGSSQWLCTNHSVTEGATGTVCVCVCAWILFSEQKHVSLFCNYFL